MIRWLKHRLDLFDCSGGWRDVETAVLWVLGCWMLAWLLARAVTG